MGAAFSVGNSLAGHQSRTTFNLLEQHFQQLVTRQRLPDDRQRLGHVLAVDQRYTTSTDELTQISK